jgi:hypothetical protein
MMKTIFIVLLTVALVGCGGYGSNSGMMAASPMIMASGGLVPGTATAGDAGFPMAVNGSGFVGGSVVYWNGTIHPSTVNCGGKITVMLADADLATAGKFPVYVQNPGGTGSYMNQPGQRSNTVTFTVEP